MSSVFRSRLPLALFAAVLAFGVSASAAEKFRLETHIYVLKSRDLPAAFTAGAASVTGPRALAFAAPATLAFAHDTLALAGGHLLWNGHASPPASFELVAAPPAVAMTAGQPLTITSSSPIEYLEPAPGGGYRVADIPADSPDAPQCRLAFTVPADAAPAGPLQLSAQLTIDTVRARASVPGVALNVGKPLLARFREDLTVPARPGDWSALLLRAPNDSDYSLLVLLRLVSPAALARQLTKIGDYHLKLARFGAAAVADDRYVYVTGGMNRGGYLDQIERFDSQTHEVTFLPGRVIARHHHGAALVDGRIYLFGGAGYAARNAPPLESALEIYDLASGQVTRGAPMPEAVSSPAVAAVGGRIFAMGGVAGLPLAPRQINRTSIYDIASNTWSSGAPMPTTREKCPAVVSRDFIVVAGGYRATRTSSGLDIVEAYRPRTDEWERFPALGARVSAHAAAVLNDTLFLFGNYDPAEGVVAYDLVTHTSTPLSDGFTGVSQAAAVTLGDTICVVGGLDRNRDDATDLIQVFTLREPPSVP